MLDRPIQVSKDSWHYKFVKMWSTHRPPDNLCKYTWMLLLGLFVTGVAVLILGWVALSPLAVVYFLAVGIPIPRVVGVGAASFVVIVGMVGFLWLLDHKDKVSPPRGSARHLAVERTKAWKDKVCPRLEFDEEGE